ncbi:oocyte zinc finger protein XlCOF6 [Dendroctonus ponderosae]|uniref:oocyte zinc finger protein XlCOF6 n=1 Tax=Dendroctonus ponderosae TaxID=77166 RepID=UPI002035EE3E|nr:oocyte zinc finger protein XlCOF6 [Dendroctonus ponderosae]KAH1024640.1 hypothetical protein HUJ05_004098 [Dendroctonus ponderosae]
MEKSAVVIALSNFEKICRICLLEGEDLQSVYNVLIHSEEKTEEINLLEIFKRHCDVEVSPTDEKPQQVCKPCIGLLSEAYRFFCKCVQTNSLLDTVLAEHKPLALSAKPEPKVKPHLSETGQSEEQRPYFSESEDEAFGAECEDDSDWEPLKEKKFKIEATATAEDERQETEDEVEIKDEPVISRRKRRFTDRIQPPIKKRGRPKKNRSSEPKVENDDCDAIENENKELICRFCSKVLPDVNTSIDHYDEVHAPELEVDECILCTRPKPYKKRDNLVYHMALHSKDSIKCIPCRKYFRTKDLLTEHLNECFKVDVKTSVKIEREGEPDGSLKPEPHNNRLSQKVLKLTQYDGAFTCQLCNENLGEIGAVIAHYETCHLDDLSCLICLRQFTQQVPLFHLGLHSRKSHICRPCRLFFHTKEEFEEHNIKYDHDKSLSCKICGKKFSRNYKKNKHMLSHLKEKNYSCNKCGKTFTYKTSLVRHFKMHFGKRFLCSSCGNVYTTKFMLQRHIRIMHTHVDEDGNPLPKPPPKPVNLQCEFCGEIFTTKYGYGRHIRRHPEFKEFKCKICSFMCDTRDQLDVHMEQKHNKHTCDVCGKRFPFESELKTHHRKHEDMETARFRCDMCGKTARTQTQLKVHYRIHTGERPFSCDTCGKSFKQTAHLKVHMFQHTGKMPFKCKLCDKSFPFQHVMEIHMRTHTGEKPFQCMFCGNAYHDRTTMQKHQKKKHPEMPLQKASRSEYKIGNLP